MFGLGQSEAVYNNTFGTSWDVSGQAGGIYHASFLGASLGDYGAVVRGATSGNIGLSVDFRANGGTINATLPGAVTLTLPDLSQSYQPGQLVTISSMYTPQSLNTASFTTQSPTLAASAQLGFGLAASAGATLCVVDCTGFNVGFNTGQQTIPIFSYNEALNGTQASNIAIDNSGLKIFGKSVNSGTYNGDLSKALGLPANTWTVNADVSSAATTVQTTSQVIGNQLVASGKASNGLLSTQVDVAKVLSDVGGISLSSGSLSDLLPSGTPGIVKDIAGLVDYNLISANLGADLKLGQSFAMQAPTGAQITLAMSSGGNPLPSVTFQAGESVQIAMPTNCDASGCTAAPLTITPEITLNPVSFAASTTLTPELTLGMSALGLSFAGLEFGPLVNWNQSIPLGTASLFTVNSQLGGFGSMNGSAFTLNEATPALGSGSIGTMNGVEIVSSSYRDVPVTGLALDPGGIKEERLVGSVLQPSAGNSRASVTLADGTTLSMDGGSVIRSIDITAGMATLSSLTGPNTIIDSTVKGQQRLTLTGDSQGSLTLQNSQISDVYRVQIAGSLLLDNSTLTAGVNNSVGPLTLRNNSHITAGSFGASSADISGGSSLDATASGAMWLGTANVGDTSWIRGYTLSDTTLNLNGGSATFNHVNGAQININGGELHLIGGDVNYSPHWVWGSTIAMNGGTLSVDKGWEWIAEPISGTGRLNVAQGAGLTLGPDFHGNGIDYHFGNGSVIDIAGTLEIWGSGSPGPHIYGEGAAANVSGKISLTQGSTLNLGSLDVQGGGQVVINNSAANIGQLKNSGVLEIQTSATLSTNSVILNNGTIRTNWSNATLNAPGIQGNGTLLVENYGELTIPGNFVQQGGTVQVDYYGQLTLAGNYLVEDGSLVVYGRLSAAELTLDGGSLSGQGRITGSVFNNAGIFESSSNVLNGDYTQGAKGVFTSTLFDSLTVNGDVTLDGLLLVDVSTDLFTSGYFQPGMVFGLLSVQNGTLQGTFSQVQFNYLGGELPFGSGWDLIYGADGIDLVWGSAKDYGPLAIAIQEGTPLPTNFSDLNQGLSPEVAGLIQQNNPGVDLNQVGLGRSSYTPPNYEAQQSVPEPSSLLLLLAGLLAGAKWLKGSAD